MVKSAPAIIAIGPAAPPWPLDAATDGAQAAEMRRFGGDRPSAIITGRTPPAALDAASAAGKRREGEPTRGEYAPAPTG